MKDFVVKHGSLIVGILLLVVVLSVGFDVDAAWYWWIALGVAIGLVKAA